MPSPESAAFRDASLADVESELETGLAMACHIIKTNEQSFETMGTRQLGLPASTAFFACLATVKR